jgi:hypothetical protein
MTSKLAVAAEEQPGAREKTPTGRLQQWLLQDYLNHNGEHGADSPGHEPPHNGEEAADQEAPHVGEHAEHPTRPWYHVLCLTGVDYFSTLGYQPGIAALAAGALSPIATLILILLTLFGAVPVYKRVAEESPHGEGSISMLERLLSWWKGKLFVLCLLGFVATDFIITITLSAADAAAHLTENALVVRHIPFLHGQEIAITLILVLLLGAVFLKGFKEAIGIAVVLVGVYLCLNAVVLAVGIEHLLHTPTAITGWQDALLHSRGHGNPFLMVGVSLLLFPKLALGLSGFETGVAVMPLIKGDPTDDPARPRGRIRNTRKLLVTAAVLMSVYLMASSVVTTLLIPPDAFLPGGPANGRALAYLSHEYLGEAFGTAYDISTILILWFAGASAMAGLLNIVPRYLPRYGMAPEWTRANRPLTLLFTGIGVVITILFKANVDAQGGAYATGVLFLMSSAAVAVTISALRARERIKTWGFGIVSLVFAYTTIVNMIERPDGIKIATFFIGVIVLVSLVSRVWRTLELRVDSVELDDTARRFIEDAAACRYPIHVVANDPDLCDARQYTRKEQEARSDHRIPEQEPIYFLEVYVTDPSSFSHAIQVSGFEVGGYRILRATGVAIPNSIAAFLLHIRQRTGKLPHAYFNWSEGSPLGFMFRYLLLGEGDTAPVVHEILRRAETDPRRRPAIHAAI